MKPETRRAIRYGLTVFVVVRVGLCVLGLIGVGMFTPLRPVSVPGWPAHPLPDPGWHNAFTSFERFDALWFLRIAAHGYRAGDGSAAFFPLYPMVVRVLSWAMGGHAFGAGLLVANAAAAGALCVLYRFTAMERSEETARRAVLFLGTFPTAFFLFAPYSESLYLLLVLVAFLGARSERWWLAAAAGAGAALTRNVGVILALALAVEALHRWRDEGRSPLPGLGAAAATGLGTLAYLASWGMRSGSWLAPIHEQADWQRTFSWPWDTIVNGTRFAFRYIGDTNGGYWTIDWLITATVLALSVYAVFRYRPSYVVFLWGSLLIPLFSVFPGRPFMSMPRFALPLFPVFWAMAELSERWRVPRAAVAAVGAAGLGVLALLFVNWYYIF